MERAAPAALLPALGLDPDDFAMTTTGVWGIVAAISLGFTGRSAGYAAISSLRPTTRPPYTPPPAK